MRMNVLCFKETHNQWPAKAGKPAGENFNLLMLDMTEPPSDRLEAMYEYRLSPDEKERYWGQVGGKPMQIAVTAIITGKQGRPYLRGRIVDQAASK